MWSWEGRPKLHENIVRFPKYFMVCWCKSKTYISLYHFNINQWRFLFSPTAQKNSFNHRRVPRNSSTESAWAISIDFSLDGFLQSSTMLTKILYLQKYSKTFPHKNSHNMFLTNGRITGTHKRQIIKMTLYTNLSRKLSQVSLYDI